MEITNTEYLRLKGLYPTLIEFRDIYDTLYIILEHTPIRVLEWVNDEQSE